MKLRKAALSDLRQVIEMRVAYLSEEFPDIPAEKLQGIAEALPTYFKQHLGRDLLAFLAEEDGKAVAAVMLLLTEKPANPNFPTGKTGTVVNVYTLPKYRRQGLAEGLMQLLITEAKERGLDYLDLKATGAGQPLYEKLGFRAEQSSYLPMKLKLSS